jgi:isocitrate dehydrogenase (NAD+)
MGTGKANPAAMVLSSTMMLRHLGLDSIANSIATATFDVLNARKVRTADMGGAYLLSACSKLYLNTIFSFIGTNTTSDFTAAIIQNL